MHWIIIHLTLIPFCLLPRVCSSRSWVISVIWEFVSLTCGSPGSQQEAGNCFSPMAFTHWSLWRYTHSVSGLNGVYIKNIIDENEWIQNMCVQEALGELATWLDTHPKEIIIITCSHFESLTDEDHCQLADYIISLFGKKLCSSEVTQLSFF